jgi:acyl-CoA synthetase (AMP-forming)/AMP-acid ligase II
MNATPPADSCLLDRLAALPPERVALRQDGRSTNVGELCAAALALRRTGPAARGTAALLHQDDPRELILRLAAWDGWCSRLVLAPAALDADAARTLELAAPAPRPGPTAWVLATSGTTGPPKAVAHTFAGLSRTVRADPVAGARFRWGLLYDPCRFAGLQVTLQALLAGSELVLTGGGFDAQVAALVAAQINALSATPTLWRKLLIDGRLAVCPLRQITLGGEIADATILDQLHAAFPAARVVHIYASTEAGVGFAVSDGRPGFPAALLDDGINGTRLRLADGRLWIRPAAHPPEGMAVQRDADGFIDTLDQVEQAGDRIRFLGRANGAINVGGNKVHPEAVEAVLRTHPQVAEARAAGRANPFTGQVVTAEVVPRPGAAAVLPEDLRVWCRDRLRPFEIPAVIRCVAAIAPSAAGKLGRHGAAP